MVSLHEKLSRESATARNLFLLLVLAIFSLGVSLMAKILIDGGMTVLRAGILFLFALLFLQLSFGFGIALTGFWVRWQGGDRFCITQTLPAAIPPGQLPGTAIVMPIFNEDPQRVFQGLRTMFKSLEKTGCLEAFDFFVLSDSNDPNRWIEEEKNWVQLCTEVNGFGRIFFRKRRVTLNYKSGNIADFCRRWGANYRYMIVLDADSVMTGEAFVQLVALMEKNRTVGIIQTAPRLVLGETFFQRVRQFADRVYSEIFLAGANFWQLGGGNYWGHNAIIRLRPFIAHCALPELPKIGALGGRILSHDTVEAALMQKAGYSVWVAYDLEGSFEESPPDLLATLKRDRPWGKGNLQHLMVLFWRGLPGSSRLRIIFGLCTYLNALIWLVFLCLIIGDAFQRPPVAATATHHLHSSAGLTLFFLVFGLLLLPKAMAVVHFLRNRERRQQAGGALRIALSALGETIFSAVIAPIFMFAYSSFVISGLTGLSAKWLPQNRGAMRISWGELWQAHGSQTLIGMLVAIFLGRFFPWMLPWMSPVLVGLIFSMPLSRLCGSVQFGRELRAEKLLLIPEEAALPWELVVLHDEFSSNAAPFFQ